MSDWRERVEEGRRLQTRAVGIMILALIGLLVCLLALFVLAVFR